MARTLPADFPGLGALQEAGEATPAKVRARIDADTLTEIPGIGPSTADKIKEAFAAFEDGDGEKENGAGVKDDNLAANSPMGATATGLAAPSAPETGHATKTPENSGVPELNTAGTDPAAVAAGEAEQKKTGAEKNEELPNHDLAELTPTEKAEAGIAKTSGERVRDSGAVFVDDPTGPYASRTAVRIPAERGRIRVLPIAHVTPQRGMMVKDGEDVYTIQEALGPDAGGDDWLKVRSPNTGQMFIR